MAMRYSGLRGSYVPHFDASNLLESLTTRTTDVCANMILMKAERLKDVSFTQPISYGYYGYVVKQQGVFCLR